MDRLDTIDRFDLNNDEIRDQQIDSIPGIQLQSLVADGQLQLPLKRDLLQTQLSTQAEFVGRFEKAGTKGPVYFNGRSDNLFG